MTIEQAIAELKCGNQIAIERIIDEFEIKIFNTILGLVQNENEAEEITQDVFIKMYYNISSFKGEATFGTWLYRIAVNESLQHIRKRKAKKWMHFFSFTNKKPEDNETDFVHPGVLLEQKESAKILFKAIKGLPQNQQVAFTLKNIEMLSQQEIASIMQISEGAVESLLSRAKQNLKKAVEKK